MGWSSSRRRPGSMFFPSLALGPSQSIAGMTDGWIAVSGCVQPHGDRGFHFAQRVLAFPQGTPRFFQRARPKA